VGRAALVTGAASGIGRAIAERLERDGAQVLSVDLEADGPGVPFAADLTTREGNRDAVAKALDEFGRLDTVIPNAGFQHVAPVEEFPEDTWDAIVSLLLTSPFLLARAAWPALRESGDGRFVAIASVHGLVASPDKAAYVSAKHGVIGLVKTLALEGAEHGIRATAVCPSYVRTPLVEGQITEERTLDDILAPQAVKELLEPADVADLVAYLVGPGGRAFTGTAVTMDLGWTAR
jgi:3-hydroxybutyrate dehydrogenase